MTEKRKISQKKRNISSEKGKRKNLPKKGKLLGF